MFATEWFPIKWRELAQGIGDCIFLLLAAVVTIVTLKDDFDRKEIFLVTGLILVGAGSAQLLGTITGYPFGHYEYRDVLGFKFFGVMPIIVPIAWFVLSINVYIICAVMVRGLVQNFLQEGFWMIGILGATLMILVDFNIEPAAVNIRGYWRWLEKSWVYYGIPWSNFYGWFLTSLILMSLIPCFLDTQRLKIAMAWKSFAVLGSIQLLFALMNWQAYQFTPVFIALNLMGILAIILGVLSIQENKVLLERRDCT